MDNINNKQEEKKSSASTLEDSKLRNSVLAYMHDVLFALAGLLLVFVLLFRMVVVSGPSMRTTLLDGDYLLVLSSALYKNPQYGDVVVISKDSFKDGDPIVKRVIATAGQTVDIDFDLGMVYVDGVALEEPYTLTPTNIQEGTAFPLTVEEGCVFVMGDNRNESKDSRHPEIGMVDEREVLGKVLFVLFPAVDPYTHKRDLGRFGAV